MDSSLLRKLLVHYVAPRYPLKPYSLSVNPTLRCSSRCAHCTVWAEKRDKIELAPVEWRRIFSDPFFANVHTFWLSGGEPTLRDDLHEIAVAAIESLPALESLTITTNALAPQAIDSALRKMRPHLDRRGIYAHLHISLDGPPDVHDRIRGVEGAYASLEQTIAIAKKLRDEGAAIGWSFNCVMQPGNVDYLTETREAARALGGEITFNLAETAESFYRSRRGAPLDEAAREKILAFIKNMAGDNDPYHRRHYETLQAVISGRERPYRCETMEATIYLDPDASIFPCPRAYGALDVRLTETSPMQAWKAAFERRETIRRTLCPTCALGCSFGEGLSVTEFFQLLLGAGQG